MKQENPLDNLVYDGLIRARHVPNILYYSTIYVSFFANCGQHWETETQK